jgi:O-acetyl-ADP-ribose deacetylase (regulator of RNase III)
MDIAVTLGDITKQTTDAIVNAANSSLLGSGGVDGAIHRAAGPALLEECLRLRQTAWPKGLPVGQAVATRAYDLPSRWVIHTVGPNRYAGQTDPRDLQNCFRQSLRVAREIGARSIAFPAISAGVYGWSPDEVAATAAAALEAEQNTPGSVGQVRFVLFSQPVFDAFAAVFG